LTASSGPPRGSISLRWTEPTSPGITQNRIYRRADPGGSYPSTPTVTISAATSYVNSKLSSGTRYCYQVTAVTSGGESTTSNEACANAK
jgi:fibronectin type 3 domain-containing protein